MLNPPPKLHPPPLSRRTALAATALAALPALPVQAQAPPPDAVWGSGPQVFSLATGSPGELGLLEALANGFASQHAATLRWHKAGSGQAMRLLQQRQVDMVLAHAPAAERRAVADGWATGRVLVGGNEFWLLGPLDDPAQVAQARSAAEALARVQDSGAKFVSRGDNSGTHQKELEVWTAAGRTPGGPGYIVTQAFMTASMRRAHDERAYFLTDSSTFIAEQRQMGQLKRLFRGGEVLANPYHTLYLSEPTPGAATARLFGEYLLSAPVQALLRSFGQAQHGEPMYFDAAATARMLTA